MTPYFPPDDIKTAIWIGERTKEFASSVNSILPSGYDFYGRILHPAYTSSGEKVKWKHVADKYGVKINPKKNCKTVDLLSKIEADSYESPLEGALDYELFSSLVSKLGEHTSTPELCWYAVWDGYCSVLDCVKASPTFPFGNRTYHLLRGALDAAPKSFCYGSYFQSPNILWPDDRSWVIHTEIDFFQRM